MDKRDVLLQAALSEFSLKGYEAASTNRIIQSAGVSKGILFHYYGDKQSLYMAVVRHCLDFVMEAMGREMEHMADDVFEALVQLSAAKRKLFLEHAPIFGVLRSACASPPKTLRQELKQMQQQMENQYVPLLKDRVNHAHFREGVDPDQALQFILISLEALVAHQLAQNGPPSLDDSTAEADAGLAPFLDMLKYGVYRTGQQGYEN
ncbi:TetR/AcrR family transcriptional regulator [Paenibacillus dendritiformis]|uniref:TetR/AcrR family transcriptional regulator n=1 Tax=Paenibacillus dendritiformis TaxID=130049 RepID=UPI00387E1AA0